MGEELYQAVAEGDGGREGIWIKSPTWKRNTEGSGTQQELAVWPHGASG